MDNPMITLIIPMYNESLIIADTAKTLSDYMQKSFDSYEILFSDDGSTDGCGDIVKKLDLPCVRVVGY
ncbi:MAG: glycosyltransferase, partial [Clostridia bacterium]|nr:glycosyltransferase [Clostridia bacterium]